MVELILLFIAVIAGIAWMSHVSLGDSFDFYGRPEVDFEEIEEQKIMLGPQDTAVRVKELYDSHEVDEETFSAFNSPDPE